MKTPPSTIGKAMTLFYVVITNDYKHTGNTTHSVGGSLIGAVPALAICQYKKENGYYLFGCNEEWEPIITSIAS